MSSTDWLAGARVSRLDNGLTICVLEDRRVPLVATALTYGVGTRAEPAGRGGMAHFLEHMMFKGSALFAQGEVDRRTQQLGGSNNAFTSHDATVYHFAFSSDHWHEALAIEADRMQGLTLDPREVASERQVILEEIAMVEDDPWGGLEERVAAELFAGSPYGRPVLGTRDEVAATDGDHLAAFHLRHYGPDNAVLAVVGDVDAASALDEVARHFRDLPSRGRPALGRGEEGPLRGHRRLRVDRGEVPRLLAALPAPPVAASDHAALRLAVAILAGGRSSRLQRRLVEEGKLAPWVSLELSDTVDAGWIHLALEVSPGEEGEQVEREAFEEIDGLASNPPSREELERAKAILRTEWIFAHEVLHQRAVTLGAALAFQDLDFARRYREALEKGTIEEVAAAAAAWLTRAESRVVGWAGREPK